MYKTLSLLKYCIPCNAKCCKHGKTIGSPILDEEEVLKIKKILDANIKQITLKNGKKYYIILEDKKTKKCPFLSDKNRCLIQNVKPLDCLCYPIKAIYDNGSIKFIIDTDCPASKHLNEEFIEEAKKVAIKSIKRFDKETYNHWLNNHIGWVKRKTTSLEKFLAIG